MSMRIIVVAALLGLVLAACSSSSSTRTQAPHSYMPHPAPGQLIDPDNDPYAVD
ncbi:hypothetical protein [Chelatococcus composti]|jgi:Uncharacterized lipoprotein|uniref:Putative lipoprotein n=1 Tax=Chelatococcus composti TaxID=1743235 RepID=A0A841KBR8_9HYPH|nr:hypothetical protein [Chelatococcus composti]MBB6168344.1 putative lipoprotein [Chelatococcus composti]MBS7736573.1 hypothetical protein [Chelatococcus composti]GGG39288.1 hypothetical protein GCM10008026_20300 [Chelatococcus composti]